MDEEGQWSDTAKRSMRRLYEAEEAVPEKRPSAKQLIMEAIDFHERRSQALKKMLVFAEGLVDDSPAEELLFNALGNVRRL